MLSHHPRADLPLENKLDDMLFQMVKFREDSGLRAKFAVVMQELFNVRQKREAYAHRSLIDLFIAKVLPAKAHTFAKNIVGLVFCSFSIPHSSLITLEVFKISTKFISQR